eukprot:766766-Hanusia_phi.AAC.4
MMLTSSEGHGGTRARGRGRAVCRHVAETVRRSHKFQRQRSARGPGFPGRSCARVTGIRTLRPLPAEAAARQPG